MTLYTDEMVTAPSLKLKNICRILYLQFEFLVKRVLYFTGTYLASQRCRRFAVSKLRPTLSEGLSAGYRLIRKPSLGRVTFTRAPCDSTVAGVTRRSLTPARGSHAAHGAERPGRERNLLQVALTVGPLLHIGRHAERRRAAA